MSTPPADTIEQHSALLDAWVENRRQIAALEAEASALLAERMDLCGRESDDHPFHRDAIHRSMVAEFAAAGRTATGTMEYAFTDAAFLHRGHPHVLVAFQHGDISAAHVREIVRAAGVVREAVSNGRADADALSLFDAAAVVIAERESPARTRALARELAAAMAGSTTIERHERAATERTVEIRPVGDGLALLTVILPEHLATAVMDRLTRIARTVITTRDEHPASEDDAATFNEPSEEELRRDERTIDQVRADLLTDLLLVADPSEAQGPGLDGIQAHLQVTIAATTLAGLDDRPAQLDGHGPLHPDIARDLAGRNGGWTRLFLDAAGFVTQTDTYSPTEPMRRFLRARDQHCRFPGCRVPARRCQIDHTHDHAKGGPTDVRNLSHLCSGHHALKHPDVDESARWRARQTTDGTIEWISPAGRQHNDVPPRRVMFV